eukprot:7378386-Prymnesium_polylepis.2
MERNYLERAPVKPVTRWWPVILVVGLSPSLIGAVRHTFCMRNLASSVVTLSSGGAVSTLYRRSGGAASKVGAAARPDLLTVPERCVGLREHRPHHLGRLEPVSLCAVEESVVKVKRLVIIAHVQHDALSPDEPEWQWAHIVARYSEPCVALWIELKTQRAEHSASKYYRAVSGFDVALACPEEMDAAANGMRDAACPRP